MFSPPRLPSVPHRIAVLLAMSAGLAACARIAGLEDHHLEQPGPDATASDAGDAGPDAVEEDAASVDSSDAADSAEDAAADVADSAADVTAEEPPEAGEDTAPEAQPDAAIHHGKALVQADADDAMWMKCTQSPSDERLYFQADDRAIFVSADEDDQCSGLRFQLDVPAGAEIVSARLTLTRVAGDILADHTLTVRAWASSSVPPFDDAHTELAAQHDPGGLLPESVGAWKPGTLNGPVTTPDLTPLLQAVVDRPDWASDAQHRCFGLLLMKEQMGFQWIGFADSSGGLAPATLDYEWIE